MSLSWEKLAEPKSHSFSTSFVSFTCRERVCGYETVEDIYIMIKGERREGVYVCVGKFE